MRFWVILLLVIGGLWLNNSSLLVSRAESGGPRFLAHRGVHQTYAGTELRDDTCTANPVAEITHAYIENTLPSMEAAFALGAAAVELDVHLTPDNVFAVFHDWTLECRTNGTGQTNQTPYADLKALDVGYGYSADGVSFPLRGKGVGLIPTLDEVFEKFPDGRFLINFKSDRRSEGVALADGLLTDPKNRSRVIGIYGGAKPTRAVLERVPGMRGFDWSSVKDCLLRYALLSWSGYVPAACENSLVAVPSNVAPFFWGWPRRFEARMARAGTEVILVGHYDGGRRINGIDTPGDLADVPEGFSGYIWTNNLPALK